jgi:hypothetical protein
VEAPAAHDLHAVKLRVLDEGGAGCATLIDPPGCADLLARLASALRDLIGEADQATRAAEAQTLIETLVRVGLNQSDIAKALGVSNSYISMWKRGMQAPSGKRLTELRLLLRKALRTD